MRRGHSRIRHPKVAAVSIVSSDRTLSTLTCRDAAKAVRGLRYQTAYNINLALAQLGVVESVSPHTSQVRECI
jgi:hypothetical protein